MAVDMAKSVQLTPGMMTRITKEVTIVVEKGATLDLYHVLGNVFGPYGASKQTVRIR
jgi:hypothetical protein